MSSESVSDNTFKILAGYSYLCGFGYIKFVFFFLKTPRRKQRLEMADARRVLQGYGTRDRAWKPPADELRLGNLGPIGTETGYA